MKKFDCIGRFKSWTVLILVVAALSAASCSGQKCTYCNENQQGIVHRNLKAEFDTTVHFSLFIPSGTVDKKMPLIVFFDAHGKTVPALEQYKQLAEQYHIAMAGFDASANEVPFEQTQKKFKPWLAELTSIAPVDTSILFLAGFSGGARVASLFENLLPQVKATALCGAGPANPQTWINSKCPCMAFCGSGDFNYIELLNLQSQSRKTKYLSVTVFSGIHQWPTAEAFEAYFVLVNRIVKGPSANDVAENEILHRCQVFASAGRPDMAIATASGGIYALQQANASKLVAFADSLGKAIPETFIKEYDAAMQSEMRLQNKIRTMFQFADTLQMASFLDSLKMHAPADTISLSHDLSRRLKAYCGIVAYSYSSQAFKGKTPQLFSQLRMYQMVEPNNNEMLFLFSAYFAAQKQCAEAQQYLNKAKQNGFSDRTRYNNTHEFDACRSEVAF